MKLRDKKGRFISKYANHSNKIHESQILLSNELSIMRKSYKVTGSIIEHGHSTK